MKKLIAFVFIIFILTNLNAQNKKTDSLKLLLNKEKTDTGRVNLLLNVGGRFGFGQAKNDSSFWYLQQALELAQKIKYTKGEIEARSRITGFLSTTGNYPEALKMSLYNLKMAKQFQENDILFFQTRQTGWIYGDMGDNREELNYEKKLSELIHSIIFKDTAEIRRYNFIAENCVANAYANLQMPDSALYYELLAYEQVLKMKSGASVGLALTTVSIGGDYSMMGNDDSAFFFYRMSIPFALQSQRRDIVAGAQLGMAALFNKKGQSDSAFFYNRQSLSVLQSTDDPTGLADAYSLLSKLYQGTHQYDSAYKYLRLSDIMKDSVNNQNKIMQAQNLSFNETLKQQQLDQAKIEERQQYESKIKGYIFTAIILVFLIIAFLLLRNNRNKRKANILLSKQKEQIENTLSELKSTQKQLIHSEKMASLGELTAGIAHEIQNPLNFVNNFSDVNKELVDELQTELNSGNTEEAISISNDIKANEEKINHHGKRAGDIVKGMLQHSRSSSGAKEPTDINALADEYLRLSYHGLRAKDKSFNAKMETHFDETIGKINIIPQDIGRVLLNLYNNAFYAVNEKQATGHGQPTTETKYDPTVSVTTKKSDNYVIITVSDNGNGIPEKIKDKIFQPFFTTKPTGSGTGLGLSLSYDIIKAHGGEIKEKSKEGKGSTFIIELPNL